MQIRRPWTLTATIAVAVAVATVAWALVITPSIDADYLRAITLGFGTCALAFALLLLCKFVQLTRSVGRGTPELPLTFVAMFALSYLTVVALAHGAMLRRVGEPFAWLVSPPLMLADLLAVVALAYIWDYELGGAEAAAELDARVEEVVHNGGAETTSATSAASIPPTTTTTPTTT